MCNLCVICNLNRFHSFIFKFCIMIVHTLKMCTGRRSRAEFVLFFPATQSLPNNEWFEYDVTDEQGNTFTHTAESADTAAAIQSLLDMQANGGQQKPKVTVQRSASIDIGQLSDQLNQQQFYTIGKLK